MIAIATGMPIMLSKEQRPKNSLGMARLVTLDPEEFVLLCIVDRCLLQLTKIIHFHFLVISKQIFGTVLYRPTITLCKISFSYKVNNNMFHIPDNFLSLFLLV